MIAGIAGWQTLRYAAGHYPQRLTVADLDKDGWPDLAVDNQFDYDGPPKVTVLRNAADWPPAPPGASPGRGAFLRVEATGPSHRPGRAENLTRPVVRASTVESEGARRLWSVRAADALPRPASVLHAHRKTVGGGADRLLGLDKDFI